jgi:hypothetical protein
MIQSSRAVFVSCLDEGPCSISWLLNELFSKCPHLWLELSASLSGRQRANQQTISITT